MTTNTDSVEVGDIFRCSRGYDQTNVDYYQVVAVSKTGRVKLAAHRSWVVDDGPHSTKMAPDAGNFTGETTGYKAPRIFGGDVWVTINSDSHSVARRVDRPARSRATIN